MYKDKYPNALDNLKVAFVDDELAIFDNVIEGNLAPLAKQMEARFSYENTCFFKHGSKLLEYIADKNNSTLDLIFIDYKLSGKWNNGVLLGNEIATHNPTISLVILSAHNDFSFCQEAIRSGFDDYLLKGNFVLQTDIQRFTQLFNAEIDRILELPSFKAKQKAKAESERANENWDGYIERLKDKGLGWSAYNKANWLLVAKILKQYSKLGTNQVNHLLPEVQGYCEKYVQKNVKDFSFTRLQACKDSDTGNDNAELWLNEIIDYCNLGFEEKETIILGKLKQSQTQGKNIWTNYLSKVLKNQDKKDQITLFITLNEDATNKVYYNKFSQVIKQFEEILSINEYYELKKTPKID